MDRPIEMCYWVEPGKFLAGEYPRRAREENLSQAKIDALVNSGVRTFIDLTTDADPLEPYAHLLARHHALDVTHHRFPIPDVSTPVSVEQTRAILDTIDAEMAAGRPVYVHCWGGVGRTGTIVGCWLARHGEAGEAALTRLRELWQACPKSARRQSPETAAQERYIETWVEP